MKAFLNTILIILITFSACKEEEGWKPTPDPSLMDFRNFVTSYMVDIDTLEVTVENSISLVLKGWDWNRGWDEYDELALKYNDTDYTIDSDTENRQFLWDPALGEDTIVGIHVTCLEDFNDKYPAGTNMDVLFNITYNSAKEVLASHYATLDTEYVCSLEEFNQTPDKYLLANLFVLKFRDMTEIPKSCLLEVKCSNTQGTIWSTVFRYE